MASQNLKSVAESMFFHMKGTNILWYQLCVHMYVHLYIYTYFLKNNNKSHIDVCLENIICDWSCSSYINLTR